MGFIAFPKNFRWGAATSSYQIEGAWKADGKGESVWDRFTHTPGRIARGETGDVACDHYRRYRGDLDLMKRVGLTAYRFSVSWPRILPSGRGRVNSKGLGFYDRLVDGLLERGIEPFATLFHWDLPQAVHDAGGWLNRRTPGWFAEYAALVVKALGDRVRHWMTLNEPGVVASCGYANPWHAPGVSDPATSYQVFHHLILAHGRAVRACRAIRPRCLYGIAPNLHMVYPSRSTPAARRAAGAYWDETVGGQLEPILYGRYPAAYLRRARESGVEWAVLPGDAREMSPRIDFLGINYYFNILYPAPTGRFVWGRGRALRKTDLGWPDYPVGLRDLLMRVTREYGPLALYVTENGAAYFGERPVKGRVRDSRRVEYLKGHIRAVGEAVDRGADVRGYFVWTFMDNFEWSHGYKPRFGIVHNDFRTQRRTLKDSGRFYGQVARENGICT